MKRDNEAKIMGFKLIAENIKIIGILLLAVVLIISLLILNKKEDPTWMQQGVMQEVTVINKDRYAENRGVLYDGVVKQLEKTVNSKSSLKKQTGSFNQEQIDFMKTDVTSNIYLDFENIFSEESFIKLNENIIVSANKFADTDEFMDNVRNLITLNATYGNIYGIFANSNLTPEALYQILNSLCDGSASNQQIIDLITALTQNSNLSSEEIYNFINELKNNNLISNEIFAEILNQITHNLEFNNDELNVLIEALRENVDKKDELLAKDIDTKDTESKDRDDILNGMIEDLDAKSAEELKKATDELTNNLKNLSDSTSADLDEFKNETTKNLDDIKKETSDNLNDYKDKNDAALNEFKDKTESTFNEFKDETESNFNSFKTETENNFNTFKEETTSNLDEIKGKSILVGEYDETTNTLTIEKVTWD